MKMKAVVVLLAVFLVSADAEFSVLKSLFSNLPEKIPKIDFTPVSEAVHKLSTIAQKLLSPKPEASTSADTQSPQFCRKYDCPDFYEEKLNTTDYILRCYPKPYMWVSTGVKGEKKRGAFMRLFKYISGNNKERMKIKMTVPVTMQIKPSEKSDSLEYRTMSFFIPFKHQKDAPIPSAGDVSLTFDKPFCAYVKVYGGWSNREKIGNNYKILAAALKRDGLGDDFSTDGIYSAGYDDPMEIFNRRNEIWLVSKTRSPSVSAPDLKRPVERPDLSLHKTKYGTVGSSDDKSSSKSKKFCGNYDCPDFYEKKLNISGRNYTLRCYPNPYKWVSTTVTGMESEAASRTAFWRLFNYIQGSNVERMKIKMTVPVTMEMQPRESESESFSKENYTMSFFIPFKHQKDAPAPSVDNVRLTEVEPLCAYVKAYGGYSNMEKVKQHYNDLKEELKRDGLGDDFHTDVFYTAGYDSPFKMQSFAVLLALIAFSSIEAKPVVDDPEPNFCHELECPHFKTVNTTAKYELRCYEEDYKWVSTIIAGYEYDKAVHMGFMLLFNYIQGENEKKQKIPMTAPVAVIIQPGQGPFCKDNFTVNFFVPFEDQTDPAAPTNKTVFISTLKKFCTYVKVYGGYSNIDYVQKYSEELGEDLVKDGLGDTFRKDLFFYAGYDSPFRVFDRHNEIWFIKKDNFLKS